MDYINLGARGPFGKTTSQGNGLTQSQARQIRNTTGILHFAMNVELAVLDDGDADLGIDQIVRL